MNTRPSSAFGAAPLVAFLLLTGTTSAQGSPDVLLLLESPDPEISERFGTAVAGIGDVDGDDVPDLLIGAEGGSTGLFDGRAHAFSGRSGALLFSLESPDNLGGLFGSTVAGTGDLDGDGVSDLLIAAPFEGDFVGRVYTFSGSSGDLLQTISSPTPESSGLFGITAAVIGDVDGDGATDFLIGAEGEGRAHLFSGTSGTLLRSVTSPNAPQGGRFGSAVAGTGDLDGDGVSDFLVGAPSENSGDQSSGRAYVFSGTDGAFLYQLDPPEPRERGYFGRSVSGLGDVDGGDLPDLLVGAEGEEGGAPYSGRAHVFSGETGAFVRTLTSPTPEPDVGRFGSSLAGIGDADGDGVADLAVGAPYEETEHQWHFGGNVHVFSGATGDLLFTLSSPRAQTSGQFGRVIASVRYGTAGLYDGLLISAHGEEVDGAEAAGRAYLFGDPRLVAAEAPPSPAAGVTAYPNPFLRQAAFSFTLAEETPVQLTVRDLLGREVVRLVNATLPSGYHVVPLDARGWPAGVYAFQFVAGEHVETGRITRLR